KTKKSQFQSNTNYTDTRSVSVSPGVNTSPQTPASPDVQLSDDTYSSVSSPESSSMSLVARPIPLRYPAEVVPAGTSPVPASCEGGVQLGGGSMPPMLTTNPQMLPGLPPNVALLTDPLFANMHLYNLALRQYLEPSYLPFCHDTRGFPYSLGGLTSRSGRRRGGQVRFTGDQTRILEDHFNSNKYITPHQRKQIAQDLQLHERQVKTWFQNRRAKMRKVQSQDGCDNIIVDSDEEQQLQISEQPSEPSPIRDTVSSVQPEEVQHQILIHAEGRGGNIRPCISASTISRPLTPETKPS
ncbi:unnamed protein product, partial [Meganyctiphanes norvegica]